MTVFSHALSTNNYGSHKFIVDSSAANGTHTTITSAIASAVVATGAQTIMIRPGATGTYTENFTLPANINLVANTTDGYTPAVTIIGKITCNDAGTRSISGIRLQTNGDNFLNVTGSAVTVINIINCFLNCSNADGINFDSSNASSVLSLQYCEGDTASTRTLYISTSAGSLDMIYCFTSNSGSSTKASTNSAGAVNIEYCGIGTPVSSISTAPGTGSLGIYYSSINYLVLNAVGATFNGSGANSAFECIIDGGTSAAVSVGSTAALINCVIQSTNGTAAITGTGTVSYGLLTFIGSNSTINTTIQTSLVSQTGRLNLNTALTVPNGGTGATTLTGFLTGNGTSAVTAVSASTQFNTVAITGSTATGTNDYAGARAGQYVQIGPLVIYSFTVAGTIAGTNTGNFQVSLPVASLASGTYAGNNLGAGICNVAGANNVGSWKVAGSSSVATYIIESSLATVAIANGTYNVQGTICYFAA